MKPSINFFILSIALFSISFSSCKKDEEVNTQIPTPTPVAQTGMFKVEFEHVFNGLDFSLGSVYVNALGQDLKYIYIQNTTLYVYLFVHVCVCVWLCVFVCVHSRYIV